MFEMLVAGIFEKEGMFADGFADAAVVVVVDDDGRGGSGDSEVSSSLSLSSSSSSTVKASRSLPPTAPPPPNLADRLGIDPPSWLGFLLPVVGAEVTLLFEPVVVLICSSLDGCSNGGVCSRRGDACRRGCSGLFGVKSPAEVDIDFVLDRSISEM